MNEIILGPPFRQADRRRGQIVMTLHHLAAEQKQVEQNTDWLDQAAYESRVNLLDGLSDWYAAEIGQVDKAIERIENHRYGFCVACHQAIEEARLETGPAAEFCSVCEELRAGCAASELTRCTPEVTTALRIIGRRSSPPEPPNEQATPLIKATNHWFDNTFAELLTRRRK